jgi:hypothetical protein
MSRKINWEISMEGYGFQGVVVASTRLAALGIAEAQWLKTWGDCLNDWVDQDGTVVLALKMPAYTARKCDGQ